LPINHAISFTHPTDHRPVFAIPWENVILLGTTDVDHTEPLSDETYITPDEINYLLDAAHFIFPELRVSTTDVVSTLSGVRSVLSKGKRDASKESREHAVWHNQGLITVTGGKLTTFRKLAQSALKGAGSVLPTAKSRRCSTHPIYEQCEQTANHFNLPPDIWTRLWGRYGRATPTLLNASTTELLQPIASTQTLWAELLHAARHEQIRHLEDLLLRRTRIGLLLPQGGADLLDQIEEICTPALTWDQNRWTQERQRYLQTWQKHYAPPNAHK
jgi:glycerol-3-phosphate dehydrogenase